MFILYVLRLASPWSLLLVEVICYNLNFGMALAAWGFIFYPNYLFAQWFIAVFVNGQLVWINLFFRRWGMSCFSSSLSVP